MNNNEDQQPQPSADEEKAVPAAADNLYTGESNEPELPPPAIETGLPNNTDMEVHHHAHHDHGKKTWRSYFWEFLMLFLAVFCGFLAEYQLEHYIEKQRAKEFASSLQADVKKDTAAIRQTIGRLQFCARKIDTLSMLLKNDSAINNNVEDFYSYNVYAFIFPLTTPDESTLQQLLNSGSLRYFRDAALVDSIKVYNTEVQSMKRFADVSADFNMDFRKQQVQIIDVNPIVAELSKSQPNRYVNTTHEQNLLAFAGGSLLTRDAAKLAEYRNWCSLKIFYINNTIAFNQRILRSANGLLAALDK